MNMSTNVRTSAAALAFFLGPLAWAQTWVQMDIMDESPAVSSGTAGAENTAQPPASDLE